MINNKIKIISVFINEVMFNNFFNLNSNLLRYDILGIDNRKRNAGLPKIYNEMIDMHIHKDMWLFFVHEDFEVKGSLEHIFHLDKDTIFGTFGVRMDEGKPPMGFGRHTCSNKDGSNAVQAGLPINNSEAVQTIDCQSILVHTSLLRKHASLRFDEQLTFDLYAEDLCLNASCLLGLSINVFPLQFQHYSHGKITERYHKGLAYLQEKYPNHALPGSCSFIGGKYAELEKIFKYDIQAAR